MRSELEGREQFYQTRKQIVWRYEGLDQDLLVFFVKTQGSKTLGWLIRHHEETTRLVTWFRGNYACARVADVLVYLERQERSRNEPVIFCLDGQFFAALAATILGGRPIDYRMVDREIERVLREHGKSAHKALADRRARAGARLAYAASGRGGAVENAWRRKRISCSRIASSGRRE